MVLAIHQPNFVPWLGYFHKIRHADTFVFLDNAQYSKDSFINRNSIKTQSGTQWLTVPVLTRGRFGQRILEVEIDWGGKWIPKHLNALVTNYRRAKSFEEVFPMLQGYYMRTTAEIKLSDFNISLIQGVCTFLDIRAHFLRASELGVEGASTDLLVEICKRLGASVYLAGSGATKYQEDDKFTSAGIEVQFSDFRVQPYPQLWGEFAANLSIVDALMNCGRQARALIG